MSALPPERTVTGLLLRWRGGDSDALNQLFPIVYDELRRVAARALASEDPNFTLQATELVHEAYLRLVDAEVPWRDRVHFFAIAARVIRRLVVDHARAKQRSKRGGGAMRVDLTALAGTPVNDVDLLALDDALSRLALQNARQAEALEMHFFAGLTHEQTAEAMGLSEATVDRDLRFARAWVFRELSARS